MATDEAIISSMSSDSDSGSLPEFVDSFSGDENVKAESNTAGSDNDNSSDDGFWVTLMMKRKHNGSG